MKKRRLQALLLAFIGVEETYTRDQLATYMFTVLNQSNIKDCLAYFVSDSATANDRMLTSISDQLFENYRNSYDSQQHRLRCNDYMINLSI